MDLRSLPTHDSGAGCGCGALFVYVGVCVCVLLPVCARQCGSLERGSGVCALSSLLLAVIYPLWMCCVCLQHSEGDESSLLCRGASSNTLLIPGLHHCCCSIYHHYWASFLQNVILCLTRQWHLNLIQLVPGLDPGYILARLTQLGLLMWSCSSSTLSSSHGKTQKVLWCHVDQAAVSNRRVNTPLPGHFQQFPQMMLRHSQTSFPQLLETPPQ